MAFYPDELSPIDRIRHLGKLVELADGTPTKNRRQWKSLVLGKKDMGMNNFATITEEKEDEISSDGSHGGIGGKSNLEINSSSNVTGTPVANKKIMFPKPRKYITSRVSERKEDMSFKNFDSSLPPSPTARDLISVVDKKKSFNVDEFSNLSISPKSTEHEPKKVKTASKQDHGIPRQEYIENYALCDIPIESQWREAVLDPTNFVPLRKGSIEKIGGEKCESIHLPKTKEDKKKITKNMKIQNAGETNKQEGNINIKKSASPKKGVASQKTTEETTKLGKTGVGAGISKEKPKTEKSKTLNMKEVVNVYKNLAYGSKDEIKSFVENLSFVKDEPNVENDKNLLSVMNLKVLENKIKNFTKKNPTCQEATTSQERGSKAAKPPKKSRKAHIERLARHKVVKVPAVLKSGVGHASTTGEKSSGKKDKKQVVEDKEPWKYVGMESALDKTYFVYPAYPPSVNLKKVSKKPRSHAETGENKAGGCSPKEKKKEEAAATVAKETKVKPSKILIRQNGFLRNVRKERTRSAKALTLSRTASNKDANRPSATTVCRVEFGATVRPVDGETPKAPSAEEPRPADPSLLVYLHGTKAINVKSPYSDKQFSRVKFFRKDGRGVPLIRGLDPRFRFENRRNLSVRNIKLPKKSSRVIRSLDLLDFDEDIQNITDFLRSQNQAARDPERERSERERRSLEDPECRSFLRRSRQRRAARTPFGEQDTRPPTFSPDTIVQEITRDIQHLQYLPDTEENRNLIAHFFDELDNRIEASKNLRPNRQKWASFSDSFNSIPILGY